MTGNGSPLDGIGRFSIVSLSFRVCAKANVGLMRAAPTPAASRKKLVRDKSLVSKDFELRRIVKRFLCIRSWPWCRLSARRQRTVIGANSNVRNARVENAVRRSAENGETNDRAWRLVLRIFRDLFSFSF